MTVDEMEIVGYFNGQSASETDEIQTPQDALNSLFAFASTLQKYESEEIEDPNIELTSFQANLTKIPENLERVIDNLPPNSPALKATKKSVYQDERLTGHEFITLVAQSGLEMENIVKPDPEVLEYADKLLEQFQLGDTPSTLSKEGSLAIGLSIIAQKMAEMHNGHPLKMQMLAAEVDKNTPFLS